MQNVDRELVMLSSVTATWTAKAEYIQNIRIYYLHREENDVYKP